MGTDCKDSYWVECLYMMQIYYYIYKGTCTRRVTLARHLSLMGVLLYTLCDLLDYAINPIVTLIVICDNRKK